MQGVEFDPLRWEWRLSSDTDVNYMVVAEALRSRMTLTPEDLGRIVEWLAVRDKSLASIVERYGHPAAMAARAGLRHVAAHHSGAAGVVGIGEDGL